ncbi:MAG TPA: hypothetical protein VFG00_07775 [Acidothermaceae bacterium]|nr:hypothetical protein [Acidothermaceae bacterium]
MGNGLAEVGFLAVLTIIVLPCGLFTLLALLDRLERNLDPDAQMPPTLVVKPEPVVVAAGVVTAAQLDDETVGGDVVSLPIAVTVTESPAAATG